MFSDGFDRNAYAKELQSHLRTLRAISGLTQQETADRLGIVRSTYVGYENGTKVLSWEKCLAICFMFATIPAGRKFMRKYDLLHGLTSDDGREAQEA